MEERDLHQLGRFLRAQEDDYATALRELQGGQKRTHWIWYVFPQVAGLGRSSTAEEYAIRSRAEAEAYLEHEVLGERLRECAAALLAHRGRRIGTIMGYPDDLKLRSSMTLFAAVAGPGSVFDEVLAEFFGGASDERTLEFLKGGR